ncbi:MAG: RluA family pseudouridine synthase [Defluviitaleaceae bacterium]|nr:RluA family pseudouridine synthase [Defluviitaleaceae bacterium]
MSIVHIEVTQAFDGQRADVFLTENCAEVLTRSAAQRILGKDKNRRVKAGEVLTCEIPAPIPDEALPEDISLDILYEDGDLLVINKPRGLVVHPAAGNYTGTLVNALLHHCGGDLSGIGGVMRPGIVHRLDKDTSGLMVVAKNDNAHQALASQLETRRMGRIYNAIVLGTVKKDAFKIDLPIGRHPTDRKKMAVLTHTGHKTRSAMTHIDVLEHYATKRGRFTLIAAKLETGRTHQIRVHMAYVGHPVLGDLTYGAKRPMFSLDGQVLHAKTIQFIHPTTKQSMEFTSSLPAYFQNALKYIL